MASVSLNPGEGWSQAILKHLQDAKWVFLLASRAACRSAYVQQEMGAAIIAKKRIIPIIWDMSPSELPGWIKELQALDLRSMNIHQVQAYLSAYAGHIKNERFWGNVFAGLLVVGGLIFATKR